MKPICRLGALPKWWFVRPPARSSWFESNTSTSIAVDAGRPSRYSRLMLLALGIFSGISTIGLLVTTLVAGTSGRPLETHEGEIDREEMKKHLVWGLVYSNPDDPRGWVPKIRGIGWTVNVRSPDLALAMAVFTVATIVSVTVTAVYILLQARNVLH
jgi:hypothetical protein